MSNPIVSIIIPSFNRALLIEETLMSVKNQTYRDFECIIVDDGSTDNSEEIILTFIATDGRFKYYKRPEDRSKGANACRNFGFEKSKGDFVNWFDSDDIMLENFLEVKINILLQNPDLDFCACICETFQNDNYHAVTVERPTVFNPVNVVEAILLDGFYLFTPSPMWRKSFLENKELFNEKMARGQESDFHFRIFFEKPNFIYLDKVLFRVRVGNESISSKASHSMKSQISIFNYFNMTFEKISKSKEEYSIKLLNYIFYRQSVNYFQINSLETSFIKRLKLIPKFYVKVITYAQQINLNVKGILKLIIGLPVALVFRKGYTFFYFSDFNTRSYSEKSQNL